MAARPRDYMRRYMRRWRQANAEVARANVRDSWARHGKRYNETRRRKRAGREET